MKEINILYEDGAVLVLDKPAGLLVHVDGKHPDVSVVDWLLQHYPNIKGVGEPLVLTDGTQVERPGIVHRIDRETSGALLVAKTEDAYFFLKRQFQAKTIKKRYHAFVYGNMKEDRGTIERPIGRSPVDIRKWSAGRGARGEMRAAVTRWRVLARGGNLSFVEAMPLTGRTHQIRVHLLAEHHPVVCDKLYAKTMPYALGFTRLALHARGLTFKTLGGDEGKEVTIEAPYPDDFLHAIEEHKALRSL